MGRDPADLSQAFSTPTDALVVIYDEWSDTYDADVASWGYEVPDRLAIRLATHRTPASAPLVFDAGCGTGQSGLALAAAGFDRLVGADVSPASLERARSHRVHERLELADLTRTLPFDTASFDATVSAGVFTYLPDPARTIRELLRVTAGPVIFSQRTDLWEPRSMDQIVAHLRSDGCSVEVSEPLPYLPGHPEYGESIRVREVTVCAP